MRFKYECLRCGLVERIEGSSIPVSKECPASECRKYLFSLDIDTMVDALKDDLGIEDLGDESAKKSVCIKNGRDSIILDYEPQDREIILRLNDKEITRYRVEYEEGKFDAYRRSMMRLNSIPV